MPRGVLLHGKPGTGKTLVAKAAATEAGIPCLYASGSEFVEFYVGMGAKRVRNLFKQARELSQKQHACMIFIDEIDAVGYRRQGNTGTAALLEDLGNREAETTLNQLLNEMDGFEENHNIIIVAATNLVDTIDPALTRPGRFDQLIEMKLPTKVERAQILKIYLRNKSHSLSNTELLQASEALRGFTGAELENLVNLAALEALHTRQ